MQLSTYSTAVALFSLVFAQAAMAQCPGQGDDREDTATICRYFTSAGKSIFCEASGSCPGTATINGEKGTFRDTSCNNPNRDPKC
ncbi:hypothetical protein CSOJ01_09130 [Colletotrichum sojae]|uniref:Uncharacterized protein n=1 Tax=Colletotrichum sojae TaxID=2175907 RepID=A0A8H6J4H6_9PEZI|nr:hypothetical protein CSOJ01_09130 [Colletotrichum sojae]